MTDDRLTAADREWLAVLGALKRALGSNRPPTALADDSGARELALHSLRILAEVGRILNNPQGAQEAGAAILNALEALPEDIKGELLNG